jgi:uncharacterized membrane protein
MNKSTFIIVIALIIIFGAITGYQNYKINTLENQVQSKTNLTNSIDVLNTKNTIDSLHYINDSLSAELFVCGVIKGRYEITLELLREKNKKAADEFELIMSTQTE